MPEDYAFDEQDGQGAVRQVRLSELFTEGKDTTAQNTYNRDYHGELPTGDQMPNLNVFVRRDGRVHHFYSTELLFAPADPSQDERHVDLVWPLWNLFDLMPEGRGENWYPRLSY